MNELAITNIITHMLSVRARLEKHQISGLQTVLCHLHTAMDLLARGARQFQVCGITEEVLHQRRAIYPAMRGSSPLVVGPFPFLVLIENAGT